MISNVLALMQEAPEEQEVPRDEVDDLVYRISHDLRASVRALQELPTWILEDLQADGIELPQSPKTQLNFIASHARRIDHMLNGLLVFARVGRLQPVAAFDPHELLADVIDDLGPPRGVTISNRLGSGLLKMGRTDLQRIFMILLTNAIRHNPARPLRIAVAGGPQEDGWAITVSDDGRGIPLGKREEVLKPLVKLVSRDHDEGSGMGLAILHKIALRAGGSVRVGEGLGGRGTSVTVRLAQTG